jgi:5-methylcytosine-specific restriction enzyme A
VNATVVAGVDLAFDGVQRHGLDDVAGTQSRAMPSRPPRPCAHPGCRALVIDAARCPEHRRLAAAAVDARRGNFRDRGYSGAWDRLSRSFLREHPLCRMCVAEGHVVPATVADHVVPKERHEDAVAVIDDPERDLQALCRRHHAAKSFREGSVRRATARMAGALAGGVPRAQGQLVPPTNPRAGMQLRAEVTDGSPRT